MEDLQNVVKRRFPNLAMLEKANKTCRMLPPLRHNNSVNLKQLKQYSSGILSIFDSLSRCVLLVDKLLFENANYAC